MNLYTHIYIYIYIDSYNVKKSNVYKETHKHRHILHKERK